MAFADLFATPSTGTPSSSGWGSLFANAPAPQVDQQQKVAALTVQSQQAQAQAQEATSFGGLVKGTLSGIGTTLSGIGTDVKNSLLTAPTPKANLLQDYTAPLKAGSKSLTDTLADTANRLNNAAAVTSSDHASALQKGVAVGEAGIGALNALFSPVTSVLAAVSKVPVIGYAADAVNNVFSALGTLGADAAQQPVDALPVSEDTKAQIRPLVREVGALVAQVGVGKAGNDAFSVIADKSKQVLNLVKDDSQIKSLPVQADTAETPVPVKPVAASQEAESMVKTQLPQLVDQYIKDNGNVINTDDARELFPSYQADRSLSADVHESASTVSKAVYNTLLQERKGTGNNTVLFTAGGTGAGKSAALRSLGNVDHYSIVYDTNTASLDSASTKIDQAIAHGYQVEINFIHNDIKTALDNALNRSTNMESRVGTGRTVPLDEHIKTHVNAPDTYVKLAEKYKDDPNVSFVAIDNTGNATQAIPGNAVDFVKSKVYNKDNVTDLKKQLTQHITNAHQAGRISDRTKQGFLGSEKSAKAGVPTGETNSGTNGTGTPKSVKGAVRPIEGTGDLKPRALSQGIEAKAIENKLTDTFGDLPEYRTVNMADQAAKAAEYVTKKPADALEVAMGRKAPPKGVLPESILVAIEEKAIKEGDVATLRDLAQNSHLSYEATTMGQRIRTLAERDPSSPVGAIKAVQDAREAALKQKGIDIKQETTAITKAVKSEVTKSVKASGRPSWEAFIQEISCAY